MPPGEGSEGAVGSERDKVMAKSIDRIMVLGLDGATWTVLDPMRRRGLMPNLDALLKRRRPRHAHLDRPSR